MRISKLELQGFKSFVDPTTIDFDLPLIGIVGPNGCGKSNIVDAMRWVMGEMSAKHLRGHSMEDVIFSGSETRPPLGMASVSLSLSCEDGIAPADYVNFSEIKVTRRLYRSGESEYLINNVACRLRDIYDLFLGTGVGTKAYSMIEQGRIEFAINAKPEDRRLLIEEAAGVSKFKNRRESALRLIESTKANLLRLNDIIAEIKRQINSLDRQARKAERYKVLREELKSLEIHLSSHTYLEQVKELNELKNLLQSWDEKENEIQARLATAETTLEEFLVKIVASENELTQFQEKIYETTNRIQLLETQKTYKKQEIENLKKQNDRYLHEIQLGKNNLIQLTEELNELAGERVHLASEAGGVHESLEEIQTRWDIINEQYKEEVEGLESKKIRLSECQSQIAMSDSQKTSHERHRIDVKGRLARSQTELEEVEKHFCEAEKQHALVKDKLMTLTSERSEILEKISWLKGEVRSLEADRESRAEVLKQKQEELVLRRSQLRSLMDLERSYEGYQDGVRAIMQQSKLEGKRDKVFGVVADFIETDSKYEAAVSAALGEKLQYVVVKSHQEGVEAVSYIKQQCSGRSTFIPLGVREEKSVAELGKKEGCMGPLLNHVAIKDDFRKIGNYLLGDIVLVDDLVNAMKIWQGNGHKNTLVTLDGEVVDPYGVVSGGRRSEEGRDVLEVKRKMRELRDVVIELEREAGLQEDTVSQLEGNASGRQLELDDISRECHEKEVRAAALEKDLHHHQETLQSFHERQKAYEREIRDLVGQEDNIENALDQTYRSKEEAIFLKRRLQSEIEFLKENQKNLDLELQQMSEKLMEVRVATASADEKINSIDRNIERLEKSKQDIQSMTDRHLAEISEANQRIETLNSECQDCGTQFEELSREMETVKLKHGTVKEDYESLATQRSEKEISIRSIRKENDLAREHTGNLKVTIARLEGDISHLEGQIQERYGVLLKDVAQDYKEKPIEIEAPEEKIRELREKLEKMGDVNLGAIPEYEELTGRYGFLQEQCRDLENSIESLQKAIHKINHLTRQRFEKTFELVNEKFKVLFPKLFCGGRAELKLTDENDLLNSGVDLFVQPPGKKLSHVALLSGGEKALSAVALIFSIFMVKPSPFCVLDEVDAPLDDVNVERFHTLVQEMTDRSQFILITHNKKTMEIVDALYGVTMQEPGVSKVVSVKMNELPAVA